MQFQTLVYNAAHDHLWRDCAMAKLKAQIDDQESIGQRIARLRTECGFTQRDLARETGISHRMIAYYEKQANPPTHALPTLANALGVTTDQLFGIEKIKVEKNKDMRLWRRFSQIEKLDNAEKRKIMQLLDTFIENEQLKQNAAS
jgi:transcriptional regulator with XRE-family HTH domain